MNELATNAGDRREKHMELHSAISNVHTISRHLDDLIQRLEGPSPPQECQISDQPEPVPSFMNVLNSGPDSLREMTEDAHKRIERIFEMLF
jgi:hypothetical protein